jgi:hypothetical protein
VTSPTTSATEASPQVSSSDCCTQYFAAAARSPYTPPRVARAGGLPLTLPVAVLGDVVAARIAGGAELHAVTNRMLAIPMHAQAVPKALAIRELNIFPRKDQSDNRLVRKVAPSANGRARIRHNCNKAACRCSFARWDRGSNPVGPATDD